MKKNNKNEIIKSVLNLIENSDFFEEHETYEIFPIIDNCNEIDMIKDRIGSASLQMLLFHFAEIYINIALLYAKQKLSKKDFNNFLIWIQLDFDQKFYNEYGIYEINLCYTRDKKNVLKSCIGNKIDLKYSDINFMMNNIPDIKRFKCYNMSFEDEYCGKVSYYNFILKSFNSTHLR